MSPKGTCCVETGPDRRDLLPLPYLIKGNKTSQACSSRSRKRRRTEDRVRRACNKMVNDLNELRWGDLVKELGEGHETNVDEQNSINTPSPNKSQVSAHQRLRELSYDVICMDLMKDPPADELVGCYASNSVSYGSGSGSLLLDPSLVSLPPKGVAGSVQFLDVLPKEVGERYVQPNEGILKEVIDREEVSQYRRYNGVKKGQYEA